LRSFVTVLACLGDCGRNCDSTDKHEFCRGFEAAVEAVSGKTITRNRGPGIGFDEMLLGNLDWLRQYGEVSPVMKRCVPRTSTKSRRIRESGLA